MSIKKHKQIRYYTLGLISLLFIPLSYFLAAYKSTASNERLLSCSFFSHCCCGPSEDDWSSSKVFTTVNLTSNEIKNEAVVLKSRLLVKALVKSKNPSKGIRFKLCDEMKFETIIELLNIFELEGAKIYVIDEYDIWVTNRPIRMYEIMEPRSILL